MCVGFAVELEAELAEELGGDVDGKEVGEIFVVALHDPEVGGFFEDGHRNISETEEVATIIVGGFFGTALFDFEVFDEVDDEFGEGGLVQDFGFSDDLVCIVGNGLRVYW